MFDDAAFDVTAFDPASWLFLFAPQPDKPRVSDPRRQDRLDAIQRKRRPRRDGDDDVLFALLL